MRWRRPLLLGLDNPHSRDPRAALLPRPRGSAGHRLFEMSRMSWREYRNAFERMNVCDVTTYSTPLFTHSTFSDRSIVVLGKEAWRRLGLPRTARFFDRFFAIHGGTFTLVPHPSGRNHFYNEYENRYKMTRLLRRLANGRR